MSEPLTPVAPVTTASAPSPSGDVPPVTANPQTVKSPAGVKDKTEKSEKGTKKGYQKVPWYRLWMYDMLLWLFSVIFDCFFREIRPRGAFRLPRSGPVIFVGAPHANQFVDPIILMSQVKKESNRRISFLIAKKSYDQALIGDLAKIQLAIPVVRPQDNLKKGAGKIFLDFNEDPLRIRGKGTKFTKDCAVKGMIALPQSLGASEVSEIISDTELLIRKEFKNTEKVRKLLQDGTSFKSADKVDQKSVYQYVFNHLSSGECIGIFPEGGSHDRTSLLPLKAGVAIMALGAMNNDPDCNVTIVPCGMNYFNAHKFRSRAVIEFGNPIEIPKEMVKKYANPETNRESVKELLDLIQTGLKAVTVTCDDYETLMVVQAARRLYAGNFAQYLPLPLVVEMNRRLVEGYQHFNSETMVQNVKEKILRYNEMLHHLYLPDHHVEDLDESNKLRVLPVLIFRLIKLICFFILALPGATLFSPVFLTSKIISKQKAKSALAASSVKIKANDVVATWKIIVGMVIAPIVYSFYATIGTWYCYKHEIFKFRLVWLWLFLYMCGVLVTYSALITGEQGLDLLKSLRPLYLSITNGSSVKALKKFRNELSEDITELVNTFGPQLYPNDFNLLKLKDQLNMKEGVNYVDSDEEEDKKTEELKNRRLRRRKAAKRAKKEAGEGIDSSITGTPTDSHSELSLQDGHSSSVSDGISLMNSDNSLTNIPMFSDYHLHQNARNPDLVLEQQSTLPSVANSTASIFDDYRFAHLEHHKHARPSTLSREASSEHIELNFGSRADPRKSKLTDKIKNKIRENRKES
ncbi:glycerol-3-phosphate O-acyltransferase [Scheffersomyces xylosifermentans]|uniref:glycerol-3-phosphate O-acyltransferase n=1 Tax=Scheffersomyces xylosifermentans TaxID=1304137 RepID=UPI00315DB164